MNEFPWNAFISFAERASIGVFILIVLALLVGGVLVYFEERDKRRSRELKISEVEQRILDEPGKPQLAWDLARTKLESYLDRNLSQVRLILWLTYFVMFSGFSIILYGLYKAFQLQSNVTVAVVGSASGVIVSFIGGSFLVIYKSILSQASAYVAILERINAVGMAVQVLSGIPDQQADLKHKTTAQLASDLIKLYGATPSPTSPQPRSSIRRR